MPEKPYDATLKDLMEEHAADWPALLGPWPVLRAQAIDVGVSTVTAAAKARVRRLSHFSTNVSGNMAK